MKPTGKKILISAVILDSHTERLMVSLFLFIFLAAGFSLNPLNLPSPPWSQNKSALVQFYGKRKSWSHILVPQRINDMGSLHSLAKLKIITRNFGGGSWDLWARLQFWPKIGWTKWACPLDSLLMLKPISMELKCASDKCSQNQKPTFMWRKVTYSCTFRVMRHLYCDHDYIKETILICYMYLIKKRSSNLFDCPGPKAVSLNYK